MELEVYKKSDFYEDYIDSQKEYYECTNADAYFAERLAEKDKEIAELKKKLMPCLNGDCILTCEVVEKYGKENAELKAKLESVQAKAEKEACHQKFKLCLDKAKWCEAEVRNIRRTPLCDMDEHEGWQNDDEFWQRWHRRWLELAEKFKEGV